MAKVDCEAEMRTPKLHRTSLAYTSYTGFDVTTHSLPSLQVKALFHFKIDSILLTSCPPQLSNYLNDFKTVQDHSRAYKTQHFFFRILCVCRRPLNGRSGMLATRHVEVVSR